MIDMTRKLALVASIGLALASVSFTNTASAQIAVGVNIGVPVAPPRQPPVEVVPEARPGWIWAHGYWAWDPAVHHHVWVPGHWERERPGLHWHEGVWVQAGDGWHWHQGYWAR